MDSGTLIDLGHDWQVPYEAGRPRYDVRRTVAVLLGVVCLLLLGVGEPGRDSQATVVAVSSGPLEASLSVTDTAVYVAKRGNPGSVLSAYRLDTGRMMWRVPMTDPIDAASATPDGSVVMAYAFGGGTSAPLTIALDGASGRVLWQRPGAITARLIGSEIAIMVVESDTQPRALLALSIRTGKELWIRQVDPGLSFAVAAAATGHAGAERVVLGLADGTVRVLDAYTGRQTALATVAGTTADPTVTNSPVEVDTAGEQVFTRTETPDGPQLTAYDMGLRERWSVRDARAEYLVAGCGSALCAMSDDAVAVLDPLTGAERWSSDGWATAQPVGAAWLMMAARLDNSRQVVADAATGRVVSDLSGWIPLSLRPPLFGHVDTAAPDRTWLALLDESSGRLRVLGHQDGVITRECRAGADHLACPTVHGSVLIWRYG